MSSTSPASPVWDYQLVIGERLSSRSSDYLVQSFLGQGTFGTVAKCMRLDDMKTVAIKMMKNEGPLIWQAKVEASNLLKLKSLDSDKCNLVRYYQDFTYRGHICLEFEHLDKSLYDFLVERCSAQQPVLLKEIRPIVQQIANALHHLKTVGMIHADLKLENVMLANHVQEPYRLKVIDFGLAGEVSAARVGSYIQTLPYRSPEILLGLPYTEAVDMWSLGCLAVSLYIYSLLYPGTSEYDMIRYIVETQGQPPDCLLNMGCKTTLYFERDHNSTSSLWKLKTPEQFYQETGIQPTETRTWKFSSLDDLHNTRFVRHENLTDDLVETDDQLKFVDLLKGMLQLDASQRLTPRQVLEHPFIRMDHMVDFYNYSSHAKSCFEIMEVCQKTETSASGSAVCESLQQPSPRTAHPVQTGNEDGNNGESSSSQDSSQDVLATTAVSLPDQHLHHEHPFKSNGRPSNIRPGIKRKMVDDEDLELHQTNSDSFQKSPDRKKFRESCADPAISSKDSGIRSYKSPAVKRKQDSNSSQDSTKYILATTAVSHPAHTIQDIPLASDSNERSGLKRKRVRKSDAGSTTCSNCSTQTLHMQPKQRSSPHHASSSQTESWTRSGLKRKAADDVGQSGKTSDLRSDNKRRRNTV